MPENRSVVSDIRNRDWMPAAWSLAFHGRADAGLGDGLRAVAAIDAFDRLAGEKRDGLILGTALPTMAAARPHRAAGILPEPDAAMFAFYCWQDKASAQQHRSQQGLNTRAR